MFEFSARVCVCVCVCAFYTEKRNMHPRAQKILAFPRSSSGEKYKRALYLFSTRARAGRRRKQLFITATLNSNNKKKMNKQEVSKNKNTYVTIV